MAEIDDIVSEAIESGITTTGTAQVRYSGDNDDLDGTVEEAACTGLEKIRERSEEGVYNRIEGNVHYAKTDEPSGWGEIVATPAIMGQLVEVLLPGYTDWDDAVKVRVTNRLVMASKVRLSVVGEFDEV